MRTFTYHCFGVVVVGLCMAVPAIGYADPILVTPTNNAVLLANTLTAASGGVVVNSATFTGASDAAGTFTGGTGVIGVESGIVLTTGQAGFVSGPNDDSGFTVQNGAGGDPQLDALLGGATTFDASTLVIEFTPAGNQVQFSYVFGSEEYNEWVNSEFNDVFAFFVNGVNYALVPGTNIPVSINNVNNGDSVGLGAGPCMNCQFYFDNATGARNSQLDGFTVPLSFVAPVNPGQVNTLRLSIGDTSDARLDSAVFLGGGTLQVCGGPDQPPCGTDDPDPDPIPEPGTLALLGVGFAGMWYRQRRRTHQ